MIEALAIGVPSLGIIGLVAYLVVKTLGAKDSVLAARDLIDGERKLSAQYKSERDVAVSKLAVTADELTSEQALRTEAESALAKSRAAYERLLRTHLKDASDDEIRAATAAAFAGFVSSPVPSADDSAPSGLVDPFANMPSA